MKATWIPTKKGWAIKGPLPAHGLIDEGSGLLSDRGMCTCGLKSIPMALKSERKLWHKLHKASVVREKEQYRDWVFFTPCGCVQAIAAHTGDSSYEIDAWIDFVDSKSATTIQRFQRQGYTVGLLGRNEAIGRLQHPCTHKEDKR